MGKKNSKQLSSQEVEELAQLTHFTTKELNLLHGGFFKDCPSGTLNEEEFCRIYHQFFPFGDPSPFASLLFRMFDADQAGQTSQAGQAGQTSQAGLVDFKEFVAGHSVTSRGSTEEKLTWSFQLFDTDHDGYISRQDMEQVIESLYKMVGHMLALLTVETSTAEEGVIGGSPPTPEKKVAFSTQEPSPEKVPFPTEGPSPQERVEKLFKTMDLDGDGLISLKDFLQVARNDPDILEAFSVFEGLL